jgi:hypothetical protein
VIYASTHPFVPQQALPCLVGLASTSGTAVDQGRVGFVLFGVGNYWHFYSRNATNSLSDFEFDPLE